MKFFGAQAKDISKWKESSRTNVTVLSAGRGALLVVSIIALYFWTRKGREWMAFGHAVVASSLQWTILPPSQKNITVSRHTVRKWWSQRFYTHGIYFYFKNIYPNIQHR